MSICSILVGFKLVVLGSSSCIIINFFDVRGKKSDYDVDIKKLITMQKLKPGTAGVKSTKIGHVNKVVVTHSFLVGGTGETQSENRRVS